MTVPFNSYVFVLAFLPVTVSAYFLLNKAKCNRIADLFLICASLVFYGYYNYIYALFLVASVLLNYLIAVLIRRERLNRRVLLIFGLLLNIGVLFTFKYYNFFVGSFNAVLGSSIRLLSILIPIGISFYTFQQISFIVDTYRDPDTVRYSLLEYAKYATFFPYILEGPIAYHHEIIPQFHKHGCRQINFDNLAKGLWLFAIGMGKKVIIADSLGLLVDDSFSHIGDLGSVKACFVMLSYTMQIYFDFSGYCDMAVGVAKMFNIDLPLNFNSPYKALNISDFWKRWHMTLTRFFTKYVYIPLGGNRRGSARTYLNMIVVFLVSGLWHGANWTFVLWGLAHGIASVLTRILEKRTNLLKSSDSIPKKLVCWGITFLFVNLTWVMFRADTVSDAMLFYKQLFSFNLMSIDASFRQLALTDGVKLIGKLVPVVGELIVNNWNGILLAIALVFSVGVKNEVGKIAQWRPSTVKMCIAAGILVYCALSFSGVASFLYWNF